MLALTAPKNSVGEPITVALNWGIEKVLVRGGGRSIKTSVENSLSHRAESFLWGILYCCVNFGYRKTLGKRGRSIKIFRRTFLSHSAEKFSRGILYSCINLGYKKVWIRGEGVSRFQVENFSSHSAGKFRL